MIIPTHAMILAAGLGTRMRPLTEKTPKPLIDVSGRSMLARVFDHLDQTNVTRRVVNIHWLGDLIVQSLKDRADVVFSDESEALLETGGGVRRALPLLGSDPFYVLNADIVWTDGAEASLVRLARFFDPERMDALLLLEPLDRAFGYDGKGDFFQEDDGRLRRRASNEGAPFLFAGVQILHPRLFEGAPDGAFSLNLLYDKAAASGRLFGLPHDGDWYHIGDPAALFAAEKRIAPFGERRR